MTNTIKFFSFLLLLLIFFTFSCNNNSLQLSNEKNQDKTLQTSLISVESNVLRLGDINHNDTESISFVFHIKNETDSILSINKIDVSCSCVHITSFPEQLEVNQSSQICGEVDLKNQSGHIRKSIFVNYCDTCVTVLKIIADVIE